MEKYLSVKDLEEAAFEILPKTTREFYRSGATDEFTLGENKRSFQRFRIQPKCLVGVSNCSTRVNILGHEVSMPVGIAPTALQKMAHADGEIATAKAAQSERTIFILATISTTSIEEIAAAAPGGIKWFQMFVYKDRHVTRDMVLRAETAGFQAIVLSVDTPVVGIRRADLKNNFALPSHLRLANFEKYVSKTQGADNSNGVKEYVNSMFDKSITWDEIRWLKSITKLPIVAKGILRGEDAARAAEAGCAGVLVSNHGARQLDGVPSTMEVLPEIVAALKGSDVEVYMDGGVSSGSDVYKALALGAKMVFMGRPALWGLAVGGQAGVQRMLQIMRKELEYTLHLAGTPTMADITRDMVRHEYEYCKL